MAKDGNAMQFPLRGTAQFLERPPSPVGGGTGLPLTFNLSRAYAHFWQS